MNDLKIIFNIWLIKPIFMDKKHFQENRQVKAFILTLPQEKQ